MDAASGSRGLFVASVAAVLLSSAVFSGLLFGGALAGHDWDVNFQYYAWIRSGLTRHGELPLFMANAPYTQDLVANPQSPALGPLIWLLRFLPAESYVALLIVVYSSAGALGALYLARDLGAGLPVAIAAALLFAFNGFMTSHLGVGHHMILGLYLLPALLLFYRRAVAGGVAALWLAAALHACALLEGFNHPFVWNTLFLVGYAALTAIQRRSWRPVGIAGLVLLAAAGLGAVKLIPMLAAFGSYEVEFRLARLSPQAFLWSLVAPGQHEGTRWPGLAFRHGSGWWEYDVYLGPFGALFVLIGVLAARREWPLAALGCAFLALSLEWPAPFDPWELLAGAPVFETQRAPSRLMILGLFGLLMYACGGMQRVWEWGRRSRPLARALAAAWIAALAIDLGREARAWQRVAEGETLVVRSQEPDRWVIGRGSPTATLVELAPNRLVYAVESSEGCTVVYGIPWLRREAWRIDGYRLRPVQHFLAIDVPAGRHEVALRYGPPPLLLTGLGVSGATLALTAGSLGLRRR